MSNPGSPSVTITCHTPFTGNQVGCSTTDDGQLLFWVPQGKTNAHVTFQCFEATGAPCPGNNILVYHCFGIGAP